MTEMTLDGLSPDDGATPRVQSSVRAPAGRSFTLRGILVGLLVGLIICFSNMYFGLQTGW